MSKLETILAQEVEAEIRSVKEDAEAKAKALKEEAQAKAKALLEAKERQLKGRLEASIKRAGSAAELLLSTARAQAKGEVLAQARRLLEERISALPQAPEWPEILKRLAEEGLRALPGAEKVMVRPEDLPHLEAWAKEKGLALEGVEGLGLGVRVQAGKNLVENTLSGRLERAWEELSARLSKSLWG
ncbi:MAG: V-type ATP synthase subunit E [Thermaceae bacterium]